jgi:predicted nucleic acid-binding protein
MYLLDSSVLIALLTEENHANWVESTLDELRPLGGVFINQIVFSEICALFDSETQLESLLDGVVEKINLNWECSFPAGKAYKLYKSRSGKKTRMLPDFLIAAHAHSLGWTLVTNNAADIRSYFPKLKIITPP